MGGDVEILTDLRYLGQRMPKALARRLRERGRVEASVTCVGEVAAEVGVRTDPWAGRGRLVVTRSRCPMVLALLERAELAGAVACNTWAAIEAVRDKPRAALALAAIGIPTPRTFLAERPEALRSVPASCWPLLLKPHLGDNARGIVLLSGPEDLDRLVWSDTVVLAQQYVDAAGVDLKLYGVGQQVWAVRRPSPLVAAPPFAECVPTTPALAELALASAGVFGLDLYGIDVLDSPRGPLVVDVNDFPNYTSVDEADDALAEFVEARVGALVGT
jgi:ribosomal protein S6--L-glutamate ligase